MGATVKQRKISKEDRLKCEFMTPECRFSYPHIFEARSIKEGDKKKHSVMLLIPKNVDLSVMKNAIKQAKINAYGPKDSWPEGIDSPVGDGDSPKHSDKQGYAGHWIVKASSNEDRAPGVVDKNRKPILDASQIYAGCYGRAVLFAYVWEYMGRIGVSFNLEHVQKLRDGDRLDGRKSAEQAFNDGVSDAMGSDDEEDFT